MKRSVILVCVAACVGACSPRGGGRGGGSGGGNGTGSNNSGTGSNGSATYDASGDWSISETVESATGVCAESVGTVRDYTVTVTQAGSSLTVTASSVPGQTFSGTISGAKLSWSGSYEEPTGGTSTIDSLDLTITSPTSLSGGSSWSWVGDGESCSGTTTVSGSRADPIPRIDNSEDTADTPPTSDSTGTSSPPDTGSLDTGGAGDQTCASLCSQLFADGVPNDSLLGCLVSGLNEGGYPVMELCDAPSNADSCLSCASEIGLPDGLCAEVVTSCMSP